MLLYDLSPGVRRLMLAEAEADISAFRLYYSPRLSQKGRLDYPDLLRRAIESEHVAWLTSQINAFGRLNYKEQRRTLSGSVTVVKVPYNAAEIISEGEFNHYYIRGLCIHKLQSSLPQNLVAYRAKQVMQARPASQARVGVTFAPDALLADLRQHPGVETALGIPGGPCSGISVRLA